MPEEDKDKDKAQAQAQAQDQTQAQAPAKLAKRPQSQSQPVASAADDPFVKSTKALLDHLSGEPKHGLLDGLWRTCRAEYDKLVGVKTPQGRVAGDEHPDYRSGTSPNSGIAHLHNPGADGLDQD